MNTIVAEDRISWELEIYGLWAKYLYWVNVPDDGTANYAATLSRSAAAYVEKVAAYAATFGRQFNRIPALRNGDVLLAATDQQIEDALLFWYFEHDWQTLKSHLDYVTPGHNLDEYDNAAGNIPASDWLEVA